MRNRTAVGEPEVTAESNFSRISQVQAGMPSSHFLAGGMTHAEILREFPYLTMPLVANASWKFRTREASLRCKKGVPVSPPHPPTTFLKSENCHGKYADTSTFLTFGKRGRRSVALEGGWNQRPCGSTSWGDIYAAKELWELAQVTGILGPHEPVRFPGRSRGPVR